MDRVFSLHKTMHHVHVRKQVGIILEFDFEKAHHKVT
jgi:hypothetical protein